MSRVALVLLHHPGIHLGNLEPVLREHGYALRLLDATSGGLGAIDPAEADLVVVLGGEMGVYEADEHPFIADELNLLRRRLDARLPTFGVCLGAQMMAGALGEHVYKGASGPQIGFRAVETTDAGATSPVRHFSGVPVVEWHGDTFDLPADATLLASSDAYANEAFSLGDFALAVQFHPEVTEAMYEEWLGRLGAEVDREGISVDGLRAEFARYSAAMQEASERLLSEWLDALQ